MPCVTIHYEGKAIPVNAERGDNLMAILQNQSVSLAFPCNGNHTCGKCRILVSGDVTPMGTQEAQLLGDAAKTMRLACCTNVVGDCSITVPKAGGNDQISVDYTEDKAALEPIYSEGYGISVDIGTTTVVGYLFSHDSKKPLAVVGEMNRQKSFGADVLSRIVYSNEHTVTPLCKIIRKQISDISLEACKQAGVSPLEVNALCVTGNTTMLHMFAGLDPRSLAYAPFTPESLFGDWQDYRLDGLPNGRIYLPRCISAYVGADITCSILSSGIFHRNDNVLMVDIGTNGEMALRTRGKMVCCSTAAGPAFEGAGISSGSSACTGAINTVSVKDGKIVYTTIDDVPAKSICGSGLIDAVNALLETGALLPKGRLRDKAPAIEIADSGVTITQKDIAQLQLAKGAIRAGMDTLMQHCNFTYEALDQIIFCGGFGSYIDPRAAEGIGLIPPGLSKRTIAIGNAAGTGASRILQSQSLLEEAMEIANYAKAVELSTDPAFKPNYVKAMLYPDPNDK